MKQWLPILLLLALVTADGFTQPYNSDINTKGLWHLDEGTGSVAHDSSSNNNNGTITGAQWQDTCIVAGHGLYFDGSGDYVQINDSPSLSALGGFWALELSYKINQYPVIGPYILARKWGSSGSSDDEFKLEISEQGRIVLFVVGPPNHTGQSDFISGRTPVALHAMTHLRVVMDSTQKFLGIFINDTLYAHTYCETWLHQNTSQNLYIGEGSEGNDQDFKGCIDEIRISNKYRGNWFPVRPSGFQNPHFMMVLTYTREYYLPFAVPNMTSITAANLRFGYVALKNVIGDYPFPGYLSTSTGSYQITKGTTTIVAMNSFTNDTTRYKKANITPSSLIQSGNTNTFTFMSGSSYDGLTGIIEPLLMVQGTLVTGVLDPEKPEVLPDRLELNQNYPNPFNPVTTISYSLNEPGMAGITIYNAYGQKVRTLVNKYHLPGDYSIEWNGRDEQDRHVASGTYFYQLIEGRRASAKQMILLK